MIWYIKVLGEDYKSQRIRIEYLPYDESIILIGEYKFGGKWNSFCEATMSVKEPSIEEIREKMEDVMMDMQIKIAQHQNLDKGFSVWKEVEFIKDDED